MISPDLFAFIYLVVGVLFTLGLKGLSHPETARRGNFFAMIGMAIAIAITLTHPAVKSYTWIFAGMAIGAVIGIIIARKIVASASRKRLRLAAPISVAARAKINDETAQIQAAARERISP